MPQVSGSEVVEQAVENPRERNSNYFITINTNYRPTDDADAQSMSDALRAAINRTFGSEDALARIIHFNYAGHFLDDRFVQHVNYKFAVEIGTHAKGSRVHAHLVLKINHTSNIQVGAKPIQAQLRDFFKDDPRIKNIYVNVSLIKDSRVALQKYLEKQQKLRNAQARGAA